MKYRAAVLYRSLLSYRGVLFDEPLATVTALARPAAAVTTPVVARAAVSEPARPIASYSP